MSNTQLNNKKEVKYLNRDYLSLKSQLVNFVKRYFPDSWQDFSENSSGMSILEMTAYVGDILSYYQDHQFREVFLDSATEFKNIVAGAKNLGYKPRGKKPSYAKIDITATFASSSERSSYGFILNKETQFASKLNPPVIFETLYNIDFTKDDANTYTSSSGGKFYVTKSNVDVVSGVTKTFKTTIGNAKRFLKVTIPDKNIFNIVSVIDSNGNKYYEVNSLSQDSIITSVQNFGSTSANVEYNLRLKYVPRRFETTIDSVGYTTLTFGSGIKSTDEFQFIPAPEDYTINQSLLGRNDIAIGSVSPYNFLVTNSLGHAPFDTTLTIKYTSGGGAQTAVGANTITKLVNSKFQAKNSALQRDSNLSRIINSITVNNNEYACGGDSEDRKEDIKYIAPKVYAAQSRMVGLQDFIAISKSMPSRFGSIYRCSAKVDSEQNNTINLYVLGKQENNDVSNFLLPNTNMIDNLKKYLNTYRAFNDIIVIKSANIINIGIEYNIRVDSGYGNANEILANTMFALRNYFHIKNWEIEQPIYLSKISNIITSVEGVLAAYNVQVIAMPPIYEGREYHTNANFDIFKAHNNGAILCPSNSIFEVKNSLFDISGSFIVEN